MSKPLAGLQILVLEDEFLIALDVEQLCYDNGAAQVGILSRVGQHELPQCDLAILDLKLGGTSTIPLAEKLQERGTPFLFVSGYGDQAAISERFPGVTLIAKPYLADDLLAAIAQAANGKDASLDRSHPRPRWTR